MSERIAVFVEPTPNPNSLKFLVGRDISGGRSYEFATAEEAKQSSLATELFAVEAVEGVFISRDFVTVRKTEAGSWGQIEPKAIEIIEEAVSSGKPLVSEQAENAISEDASEAEQRIRQILDAEIRPAVASDGGDVVYQDYADGILTLRLVGACSGCPSSTMTLKMGIERRLKEDVPELREVVSVM